jgi:predicted nucleotide-binding protein (sugar kinase/HSP70/actin superfamily)
VVADPLPRHAFLAKQKKRTELVNRRKSLRIGIPRILNMYSVTPIFSAYFEALGIPAENLIYSDYTSESLYKEGAKRGAIDPCFPSKVGIPHVHNLPYVHHKKKPLDIIFRPMIDDLPRMKHVQSHRSCPTVLRRRSGEGCVHQGRGHLQGKQRSVLRHVCESGQTGVADQTDV